MVPVGTMASFNTFMAPTSCFQKLGGPGGAFAKLLANGDQWYKHVGKHYGIHNDSDWLLELFLWPKIPRLKIVTMRPYKYTQALCQLTVTIKLLFWLLGDYLIVSLFYH